MKPMKSREISKTGQLSEIKEKYSKEALNNTLSLELTNLNAGLSIR